MKKARFVVASLAAVLASCAPEADSAGTEGSDEDNPHAGHDMSNMPLSDKAVKDKEEAAALLVERFEVEACSKADLVGSLRRTSPEEGETMMRAFKVTGECAQGALAAVKQMGFEEDEPDTFTDPSGAGDQITIVDNDDGTATVEWEASQK